MIALIPVFVTVLAILTLKEIPRPLQAVSIITSVVGVGFIVLGGGKITTSGQTFGLVALLGAVLSAAVFNILSRWLSRQFRPVELTYVMMWVGALFFGGLAFLESFSSRIPGGSNRLTVKAAGPPSYIWASSLRSSPSSG